MDAPVRAGVVQDSWDLVENASYRERHIRLLDNPDVGTMTAHGETIAISCVQPRVKLSPLLGDHTEFVLKDLLGMDEADVDQLYVGDVLR